MAVSATLLFGLLALSQLSHCSANEVRVGIIKAEGFCKVKTNPTSNETQFVGFIPDIVNELGKRLKFIPRYQLVADGRYGAFEESTGLWNGLMGDVINSTVDFAAAPLTVTALRDAHVDFSHELLDVGLVVLIRRPEKLSQHASRGIGFFLGVFDAGVWCTGMAVFLVTSLLLHLNYRRNPQEAQARLVEHAASSGGSAAAAQSASGGNSAGSGETMRHQFSLAGCAYYTLSTGCFQGYEKSPKSLAGRCLSVTWWIFAGIFSATYAAGFLCALVASGSTYSENFAYLDARDQYQLDSSAMQSAVPVWITGGSTDAFMRTSKEPLFRMFSNMSSSAAKNDPKLANGVRNTSQLIEIVNSSSHYLGIMESPTADFYAKRSGCKLVVVGTLLNERSYALAFNQTESGHRLRDSINEQLLSMRESGFIRQAYRQYFGGQMSTCREHQSDGDSTTPDSVMALNMAGEELARMFRDSLPITLKTFCGVLVLYILGVLVALSLTFVDNYIFSRTARSRHAQVLRNMPDDEPSFRSLSYSDQRRSEQLQQQQKESQPVENIPDELA
ncbi:hypothetical protein BOX15_Mlig015393g1 [Macrostomum lignano]|uniref:PBPe domain-containing protein n=2 Tax=Macrostomum lignano TaxID=282301 RepID=A0A267EZ99_9PLAT|nr:hypothetical protein BOX15_Mlig015393g1 [Macrostomum lignano]